MNSSIELLGGRTGVLYNPDSSVVAGPFTCSDHSYVLLDTNPTHRPHRKIIFRYQPNWSTYAEVQTTVRKAWARRVYGTAMFRFSRKLRSIKSCLLYTSDAADE